MISGHQMSLYMQENGQMKYGGPPPNWIGPPPPKGTEVYISKIPRRSTLPEILPIFAIAGEIYSARLMMDFSGSNRGFGFVLYRTVAEAKNAISTINGYEIVPGHRISVTKSIDNCRLFIGQIPKDKTKEELQEMLSYTTAGVKEIILYLSPTDKSLNRGFCFVEYENHRSAAMARRRLISTGIQEWGKDVRIDWAIPEEEIDPAIMSKVTVVYIRNLMLRTTETSIKEVLCKVVSISDFCRIRKVKDFAFVHFNSRAAAEKAIKYLNGFSLDGATLFATWSKPLLEDNLNLYTMKCESTQKKTLKGKSKKNQTFEQTELRMGSFEDSNFFPSALYSPTQTSPVSSLGCSDMYPSWQNITCTSKPCSPPPRQDSLTMFSQFNEEERLQLKRLLVEYLKTTPPATALQCIAQSLGWGSVAYTVTPITSRFNSNYVQYFCAQVVLTKGGKIYRYTTLRHSPCLTPEDAQNAAAFVFIHACFKAL